MDDRLGGDGRRSAWGWRSLPLLAGRPSYQSGAIGLDPSPLGVGARVLQLVGMQVGPIFSSSLAGAGGAGGSTRSARVRGRVWPSSGAARVPVPVASRRSNDRLRPGRGRAARGQRPRGVRDDPGHPDPRPYPGAVRPGLRPRRSPPRSSGAARLAAPSLAPAGHGPRWGPGSWPWAPAVSWPCRASGTSPATPTPRSPGRCRTSPRPPPTWSREASSSCWTTAAPGP